MSRSTFSRWERIMRILSKTAFVQIFLGLTALFFLWIAASTWISLLERQTNSYLIKNKSYKELVSQCKVTDKIIVREYISHGSSATTSDSYSVYIQEDGSRFERTIWSAYSSPSISSVTCDKGTLTIVTNSYLPEFKYYKFSVDQITTELVKTPIQLYKGKNAPDWEIAAEKDALKFDNTVMLSFFIMAILILLIAILIKPKSFYSEK